MPEPNLPRFSGLYYVGGVLYQDGRPVFTQGAERQFGTANAYLSHHQEWNYTVLNPRAASIGSAKGAAGTAGATELLVSPLPARIGSIVTQNDTAAGDILLRDTNATGGNIAAIALAATLNTVTVYTMNWMFLTGITIIGSAAGVSCVIQWRPL